MNKPKFFDVNCLIDYLELYRLLEAKDGQRFDEHFSDILHNSQDPTFGEQPRIFSRLEQKAGGLIIYKESASAQYPETFKVLNALADSLGKQNFAQCLLCPADMPSRIGQRPGVCLDLDTKTKMDLASQFESNHFVGLGQIFSPALLQEIAQQVTDVPFVPMRHGSLGVDYNMRPGPTLAMLEYLVTDERIVHTVEDSIRVQRGSLDSFFGRVYKMLPKRDADGYHSDVDLKNRRVVAISVNLTSEPYRGGRVLMRRQGRWRRFLVSEQLAFGEAAIFRLSSHLEHKVEKVHSGSRTNLAGWLCAEPGWDYGDWISRKI